MIDNFKKAFDLNTQSLTEQCSCGESFHHPDKLLWNYDENESDFLASTSIEVQHPIRKINLDGIEYVSDCSCWHNKANQISKFIENNAVGISKYLNTLRENNIREVNKQHMVEVLTSEYTEHDLDPHFKE